MVHRLAVAILRRVLYLDASLCAVAGVAVAAVPRSLITGLFGQPAYPDYAVARLFGISLFTLSLLMVLVAQRVDELWWWSWAFVILEFGGAAVSTVHAAFGVPEGAAAWPWWLLAGGSWVLCFGFLWGLARAGTERPTP
jgi:hypothetical protein